MRSYEHCGPEQLALEMHFAKNSAARRLSGGTLSVEPPYALV